MGKYVYNPHTDELDYAGLEQSEADERYLKLDQTSPQSVINDVPLLETTPNGSSDIKSFVNKEYVDLAVSSLGAVYYMYDEDDATGYKTCYLEPSSDAETYIEETGVVNDQYLGGWISASGEAPDKLLKGVYDWYVTIEKTNPTGSQSLRVYWKMFERKSDSTEVEIATSSLSNEIDGKSTYLVPLQLDSDYIPGSGSRIVGKLYANVTGSGTAPDLRIYYQGNTSSRWEIPANTEIFQNIFVPYSGATKDVDLGSNNLITTGYIGIKTATPSTELDVNGAITANTLTTSSITLDNGTNSIQLTIPTVDTFRIIGVSQARISLQNNQKAAAFAVFKANQSDHFSIIDQANYSLYLFEDAASGENKDFRVYGWNSALGDADHLCLRYSDDYDEGSIRIDTATSNTKGVSVRLNDNAGNSYFNVRDSGKTEVFKVDSDGNLTIIGNATLGNGSDKTTIKDILNLNGLTADPTSPQDGDVWYRSDTGEFRARIGSTTYKFTLTSV